MSTRLAGFLANGRRPERFKNCAPYFMTHPSLLFTDTVEEMDRYVRSVCIWSFKSTGKYTTGLLPRAYDTPKKKSHVTTLLIGHVDTF